MMTSWLIFGAGGHGVGALLIARALAAYRPVTALVRKAAAVARLEQQGVKVVVGDACHADAVIEACDIAGHSATLISSMGGGHDYQAHRTVIDAAEQAGITRMILVSSLGCGTSWAYLSPQAKVAFGHAIREKSLAECWLQTSRLDYAILRPGGLLNGPATGKARLSQAKEVHGFVTRADVALHIEQLANAPELNRQIYSLTEPGLKPG